VALNFATGRFSTATATGFQQVTGLTFTAGAVFFAHGRKGSSGFLATAHFGYGWGVPSTMVSAGGVKNGALVVMNDDAAAAENSGRRYSNGRCILALSTAAPTLHSEAVFVSTDATSFTINWSTIGAAATSYEVLYYAIGGADLTNADASTLTISTATGNLTVTTGFAPDIVFQINVGNLNSLDSNTVDGGFGLGMAVSSTKQGWVINSSDDANSAIDNNRKQSTSSFIMLFIASTGVVGSDTTYVSTDASGFIINTNDESAAVRTVLYCALKGGQYDVGSFSTPTAGGVQTVTGMTFSSNGIVMFSYGDVPTTALIGTGVMCLGAMQSSTAFWSLSDFNDDASGTSRSSRNHTTTTSFKKLSATSLVSADARYINSEATSFTLNWATAPATSYQVLFVRFFDAALSQTFSVAITETTAISESTSKLKTGIRSATETTVISESTSRLYRGFRTITETTPISETLSRLARFFRSIAAQTVAISESITGSKVIGRSITETTAISETLTKLKRGFRTITETSIISETLTRIKTGIRSLATETVAISETLTKLYRAIRTLTETTIITETLTGVNQSVSTAFQHCIAILRHLGRR